MPGRAQIGLLACVGAVALGGCGSDDGGTIPPESAATLLSILELIEADVASGNCEIAERRAGDFVGEVNTLPAEVGVELKSALREAAERLEDLAADPEQCDQATDTGVGGAQSTPTEPTEPATTSTPATTTTETTTEEPPEDESEDGEDSGTGGGPPEPPPDQAPPEDPGSGGVGIGGETEATR
jgi:hypothetical protein